MSTQLYYLWEEVDYFTLLLSKQKDYFTLLHGLSRKENSSFGKSTELLHYYHFNYYLPKP